MSYPNKETGRVQSDDLEGFSIVIDGRTGQEYSHSDFESLQRQRKAERANSRFIKGPIPVSWLAQAFRLRTTSASKVSLALFYQRGLCGRDTFKIEPRRFAELGIDETTRHRGINALERANLVRVKRNPGASPIVTMIFERDSDP